MIGLDITKLEKYNLFVDCFRELVKRAGTKDLDWKIYMPVELKHEFFPQHESVIIDGVELPLVPDPQLIAVKSENGMLSGDIWIGIYEEE